MAELSSNEVGPVDVAVIRFEGSQFNGDVAPALVELMESGVVRIIDVSFVRKGLDGQVLVVEGVDAEIDDVFERVIGEQFDLLSDEDLEAIADDLDPGSAAMVIVWENSWAARLAAAIRGSQGEIVLLERVPREVVMAAIDALEDAAAV